MIRPATRPSIRGATQAASGFDGGEPLFLTIDGVFLCLDAEDPEFLTL